MQDQGKEGRECQPAAPSDTTPSLPKKVADFLLKPPTMRPLTLKPPTMKPPTMKQEQWGREGRKHQHQTIQTLPLQTTTNLHHLHYHRYL